MASNVERAAQALLDAMEPPRSRRASDAWDALREALRAARPVIYSVDDHDFSSGLSWNGNLIMGDRKSIDTVKRALHDQSNVEAFWRPAYRRHHDFMAALVADETHVLDVQTPNGDWVRQTANTYYSKEDAEKTAWAVERLMNRRARVVKVTTYTKEEILP